MDTQVKYEIPVLAQTGVTARVTLPSRRTTVAAIALLLLDAHADLTRYDKQLLVRLAEVCWSDLKEEANQ